MIPYWLAFFLVLSAVVSPKRLVVRQQRVAWALVFLCIALFVGLRHEVGADWFNYAAQFDTVAQMSFDDSVSKTKDLAYYPLGWLIAQLGGDIHMLNLACALLLSAGTVALARRQTLPWLALLAAVPYLLIVVGMGYTRQSAAIGCAMLGLVALGDGKLRKFVLWVMLGAAFHKSATLLLPIAALAATRNRTWTLAWVSVMSLLGYWLFVQDSSEMLWTNYVESDYAMAAQGASIRISMNAVPALLVLLFSKRFFPDLRERRLWLWMAGLSVACIPLLALSMTGSDRVALYFIPLQLVVFGRITRLSQSIKVRTLLVIATIAYYAVVQFVWLNFAGHVEAWIPYRSWLLN